MAWPIQTPAGGGYTFTDVPVGSTFYDYVETAFAHGVVGGYACGGTTYPCDGQNRPYFRVGVNTTRAQIATILVKAKGWTLLNPATATFTDVPVGSTSYQYIETAASKGVLGGYNTGCATGIPCFKPSNNATRGQIAKMVYNSITQR
jgi:hypothetical protein